MGTKEILFVALVAILNSAMIDAQVNPGLNVPFDLTSLTSQVNKLAASIPTTGAIPNNLNNPAMPIAAPSTSSLNPSAVPTTIVNMPTGSMNLPAGFPMPTQGGLDLSSLLSQINFQGQPKQIMNKLLPAILKLQTDVQSGKVDSQTLAAEVTALVDASMPFLNNAPKQVQTYVADIQTHIATIKTSGADPNQINAIIQDYFAIGNTILTAAGKKNAGKGVKLS